jgi:hypothetical protein
MHDRVDRSWSGPRNVCAAVDSRFRGNDGDARSEGVGVALVQVLRRIKP